VAPIHLYRTNHLPHLLALLLITLPVTAQSVSPRLFNDMEWRLIGPFRGGRAVAVGGVPGDNTTFYFGAVDGGVWKTSNAGTTWRPIFDHQPVASIGALAVSASDPKVIYVGTGESDIRSDLASGNGVYKSTDAGESWTNIGLKDTRQISKVVIDPNNPDIVYVGALGHAYGPNDDRGVYKSINGGVTWKRTLFKDANLGVADLAIAIAKPNLLFATLWNAHRPPWSTYAPVLGKGSGLYRSQDAGETWQEISGNGLPEGTWGRSGVAVSSNGQRVYLVVEAKQSGLYVSDDGGDHWRLANADSRLTSRAWYFSRITVDPSNADIFYVPNVALMGSEDGGKTVHVVRGAPGGDDYHELWVDPKDGSWMILGTDQGTTISLDRAKTWTTWYNQPTAQLYHVTTDDYFPYAVYGSQQDSGGVAVFSRTNHGQITPRDWFPASGQESGYMAIDPKDSNILYVTGGYGSVFRWDKRRSLSQDITPWPMPVFGTNIAGRKYRDPWTPPLVFSLADKNSLYLGTQYVMKTTDGGLHWAQISPDLTGGNARAETNATQRGTGAAASAANSIADVDRSDRATPEDAIERGYGTLATVTPSYLDKDLIWAGSDTGVLSLTRDGGKTWANVTPPGMLPWGRVSQIDASHFDAAVAYVSVERHRMNDQSPYIYRTRDYGRTWDSITTGLAAPDFVNAVRQDPKQKNLLYAGTEFGVFVSFDDGGHWQPLQLNLPVSSIRDLVIHGDDLVIATHGRSFWILDDITPLRQAAEQAKNTAPFLYQPATAVRVDYDGFPGTPLPPEEPTARNPPDGAILDYFLPTQARDIELRIYNSQHKVIRHVSSENKNQANHKSLPIAERWFPEPQHLESEAGMHRFIWNLAWGTSGVTESDEPDNGEGDIPRGPKVAPGNYTVELEVNGKKTPPATLVVEKDPRSPATRAELEQQFELSYKIFADSLEARRALAEAGSAKAQLTGTIDSETRDNPELLKRAREITAAIDGLLSGQPASTDSPMGLEVANTALTAALHVAESSDRTTPSQGFELYEQAHQASSARVKEWAALKQGPLAELNQQLHAHGLVQVGIAEIEREVDYFVTR
jgi:photosystem II stability/assembly factor-like uncharacterized protein